MKRSAVIQAALAAAVLCVTSGAIPAHAMQENDARTTRESDQREGALRDAWLDGKLETALLFNGHVNSFTIDTDVKSGVAYLSGSVESEIDKDLAEEIARSIDGVTEVRNDLVVDKAKAQASMAEKSGNKDQTFRKAVADATHTARVKTRLLANGSTSGLAINVDTRDGAVTLSGKVDSAEEKALAEQIAKNADGTVSVDNKLTVADEGDGA